MFGWKWNSTNGYDTATWTAVDIQTIATSYGCEGWQADTDGFKHTIKVSRAVYSYMYKFKTALALDDTKYLEQIRISATTSSNHRYNRYFIYAITATDAPAAKGFEIIGW
jgi:hypothetical protein